MVALEQVLAVRGGALGYKVPHSYAACSQHAPNEHILADLTRESLHIMAGLFWDLAVEGPAVMLERA